MIKSKRKHRVLEFFHKQEEKRPFNNLTRNKAGVLLDKVNSSVQCLSKFQHFRYL